LEKIKTLAFDLGIYFEDLEVDIKMSKIRSVIFSTKRQSKLETLIAASSPTSVIKNYLAPSYREDVFETYSGHQTKKLSQKT